MISQIPDRVFDTSKPFKWSATITPANATLLQHVKIYITYGGARHDFTADVLSAARVYEENGALIISVANFARLVKEIEAPMEIRVVLTSENPGNSEDVVFYATTVPEWVLLGYVERWYAALGPYYAIPYSVWELQSYVAALSRFYGEEETGRSWDMRTDEFLTAAIGQPAFSVGVSEDMALNEAVAALAALEWTYHEGGGSTASKYGVGYQGVGFTGNFEPLKAEAMASLEQATPGSVGPFEHRLGIFAILSGTAPGVLPGGSVNVLAYRTMRDVSLYNTPPVSQAKGMLCWLKAGTTPEGWFSPEEADAVIGQEFEISVVAGQSAMYPPPEEVWQFAETGASVGSANSGSAEPMPDAQFGESQIWLESLDVGGITGAMQPVPWGTEGQMYFTLGMKGEEEIDPLYGKRVSVDDWGTHYYGIFASFLHPVWAPGVGGAAIGLRFTSQFPTENWRLEAGDIIGIRGVSVLKIPPQSLPPIGPNAPFDPYLIFNINQVAPGNNDKALQVECPLRDQTTAQFFAARKDYAQFEVAAETQVGVQGDYGYMELGNLQRIFPLIRIFSGIADSKRANGLPGRSLVLGHTNAAYQLQCELESIPDVASYVVEHERQHRELHHLFTTHPAWYMAVDADGNAHPDSDPDQDGAKTGVERGAHAAPLYVTNPALPNYVTKGNLPGSRDTNWRDQEWWAYKRSMDAAIAANEWPNNEARDWSKNGANWQAGQ